MVVGYTTFFHQLYLGISIESAVQIMWAASGEAVLAAIERYNGAVNAFCIIDGEGARRTAKASEQRWMRGEPVRLLDGLPVTIKDAISWAGHPNREGSINLPPDPVQENAPAVKYLLNAGAIPVGKTTLPEFGWKTVGDSLLYGIIRNPEDTRSSKKPFFFEWTNSCRPRPF
jgi:aspartyl-tRNA(Asn)/glutamyl-tRNA(Gln) amidotransferase subunit A